jgi:hypothetical protein
MNEKPNDIMADDLIEKLKGEGLLGPATCSAHWPDIGKDPLQNWDTMDQTPEGSQNRMQSGCDMQQSGVPDQTALVWRIDINRVNGELIWRRAAMQGLKEQDAKIAKMLDALKRIANPRLSYRKCRELARAAIGAPNISS